MTTLNVELYDALIAIKVPEQKARAAAQAIVASDQIVTKSALTGALTGLKEDMAQLKAEMRMLKWIGGILFAALIGLQIAHMAQQ